jgi:hypothetical protein
MGTMGGHQTIATIEDTVMDDSAPALMVSSSEQGGRVIVAAHDDIVIERL